MEISKVIKVIFVLTLVLASLIFIYGFKDIIAEKINLKFDGLVFIPDFSNPSGSSRLVRTQDRYDEEITRTKEEEIQSKLPLKMREDDISPYYGRASVSASPTALGRSPFENPSVIRLSMRVNTGERVDITGWRVEANRDGIILTQAVNDFRYPEELREENIVLEEGSHRINIYSSISAINKNFRLNKCIGYLKGVFEFTPSLGGGCPSIPRGEYYFLPANCQNYINSYNGSCRNPAEGEDYPYLNDECKQVLKRLNYKSCYNEHKADSNFLSSEWRIWTGVNILDPEHDVVKLLDKEGKLIDYYIY